MMKKLFPAGLLLSLAFAAPGAHATGALERIKKAGKLVVAIDASYPPMESEGPSGKPVGFDIEFADELARRLGVKTEYVVMQWDGILAGLTSKRYDVIISSMNITPERQKQADFVEYVKMAQVFVTTTKGRPVATEKDLEGKTVAVQADSTSADFVEKARKAGLKVKDLKAFKGATDAFAAVRASQADTIVIDEPVGRYYAKQDPKTFHVTGRAMAPEPVGIATNKSDQDLSRELSRVVDAMKKDGFLKKLQESWFGGELGA